MCLNFSEPKTTQNHISQPIVQCDDALRTAESLVALQKKVGLKLTIKDKNLHEITGCFNNMADLLRNPEFISRMSQELYVSDHSGSTWFKIRLKRGKFKSITFLLTMKVNWIKIFNKCHDNFDLLIVGYFPGAENVTAATTAIPREDFTPERILKHFTYLIGETAVDHKEVGKLICYILSKYLNNPTLDMLAYVGSNQGFWTTSQNRIRFNPEHLLDKELLPFLPKGVTSRQYPVSIDDVADITPVLAPMFSNCKELQLLLLYRISSWLQFLFAKRDIYADQILIAKPTPNIPITLLVAILKNTRYDSLNAPPIGPNIKPLQFDMETINDGMLIAIDTFRADQLNKAVKGYDLFINDASGATESNIGIHHIPALVSNYAELYFPKNMCCVVELGDNSTQYSPESFKNALKRLDAALVIRIERGCNNGDFIKVFNSHVTQIQNNISDMIPRSKVNTYIMLITALRIYNEMFSPLFCADMEQFIENWLCSQEQDRQPLNDTICSEYGKILNRKIADGYFRLTLKDEVTLFDKGSRTIVVDKNKHRVYMETADSLSIAKDEMKSISDTDNLTDALYSCNYLPHNPKNEKSIRIAAVTSDGIPYPLYVHAINYTLLTVENRQRFDLIDKEANLFKYNEIPIENFLPLVKTIDGRYAGKMLLYDAEESNIYFGTGRTGSGKSWAIAQVLCMLSMLGHNVIVFDISGTYTKEKLLRMLPEDVVKHLFEFIDIGEGVGAIPINFNSLNDYNSLPDKKNAIYSVIHAAIGRIEKDQARALKGSISKFLKTIDEPFEFEMLCEMAIIDKPSIAKIAENFQSIIWELNEIGFEDQNWSDLLSNRKIKILNMGIEVGESSHQLLDMLLGSLLNWQMTHDSKFLSIAIDELIDQNFSKESPLSTIVKQGRKFHTALLGATQDYFNQGNSCLDTMKQANIKSFCRPGKSEDRVAQKLGYSNAIDAGFNKFKSGDTIIEFDSYNREICGNEAITLRGRVVDFVDTPLYEKFKQEYGIS